MSIKTHIQLLGPHPSAPSEFERIFGCKDYPSTATKRHRSLQSKTTACDDQFIDWLARKLILHHYEESRIEKLKGKYQDLGFSAYASQYRRIPNSDKVQKGNATEVLLIEYIESCYPKELIKIFKLRFNPNVDQSMKGDDALLLDFDDSDKANHKLRVILGEAKFRGAATKQVVEDIADALAKDKQPLSYTFVLEQLEKQEATKELAVALDKFILDEIKKSGDITYVGMLLSDENSEAVVERYLMNDNPELIFISTGVHQPAQFIKRVFDRANHLINHPSEL